MTIFYDKFWFVIKIFFIDVHISISAWNKRRKVISSNYTLWRPHLLQSIRGLGPQLLTNEVDDMDGDAIYSEDLQHGLRVGQNQQGQGCQLLH
jgi:hypothetical protein